MTTRTTLRIAAACFRDGDGRVLTVRKRGTTAFMFPGGKLEPGETAVEAARREVREEIGVELAAEDLKHLGSWTATAANEPQTDVVAQVFTTTARIAPVAAAEIAELRWTTPDATDPTDPTDTAPTLAPLLREHVFPALRRVSTPTG
ncbi:NUDIX domain-containing protein [Georgenia halophila]|uniref:NUDIX domain-containing protein n=1 Tax=Georgenia halophila TaxID=620889 RepID=A0ABP8LK44_9MICO